MKQRRGLRWWIVALVSCGTILNYLARNSLGALAPQLKGVLDITVSGLWLFPPVAEGAFAWSFYEDDGESRGPHDMWRGSCRSSAEKIIVSVHRDRPGTFGDDRLTLLLPPGETRTLSIEGGSAQPIEVEGRRGITLALG